jgi:hypothetical protein
MNEGEQNLYRIACKDGCLRRLDEKFGHQWTQEIDLAIVFLANNARINWSETRKKAEVLLEAGLIG